VVAPQETLLLPAGRRRRLRRREIVVLSPRLGRPVVSAMASVCRQLDMSGRTGRLAQSAGEQLDGQRAHLLQWLAARGERSWIGQDLEGVEARHRELPGMSNAAIA